MAENWYPKIDMETCESCGACIKKCSHGVYDLDKVPIPFVIHPEACVDHCHGCGNLCSAGAITYVGEDTRWLPSKMKRTTDDACCDLKKPKEIVLDFLYLDLNTCERCKATDASFDLAVTLLLDIFKLLDFHVEIHKINVTTKEMAEQYQFVSSPTIRVNGIDICKEVKENRCQACGDLCGETVDCRVFIYQGEEYEEPPVAMIVEGILKVVFGHVNRKDEQYQLPDNLKRFFLGKDKNTAQESCC